MLKHLLLATALACLTSNYYAAAETKNVICYWGTWSHYRTGNGQFNALTVDPSLCTHLIYTFVGLQESDGSVILLDSWLDIDLSMFNKTNALKQTNPNLKTLLAVGGWNEGSSKYSTMAADATKRAQFIATALKWVEDYGFDGFDLDWEYPARRGGVAADKENFSTLLKEMYPVFHNKGLLLTAAVSAVPAQTDVSYEVPVLNEYLDFINVMLYDFFGAWDSTTGINAPLNASARLTDTEYSDYNVVNCMEGWISRGASPQKLALGVPFYGRTWTLTSTSSNGVGAPASGAGAAGPYTQTAGFLGYNEIIEKFNEGGWTEGWDEEAQVPYAYNGNQWISYDNPKSIAIKVNHAKSLNLGAVMLWSIETDDFKGLCGTAFPLLRAMNEALESSSDDSSSNTDDSSSNSDDSSSNADDASSNTDDSSSNTDDSSSNTDDSSSNTDDSSSNTDDTEASSDDSSSSNDTVKESEDSSASSDDSSNSCNLGNDNSSSDNAASDDSNDTAASDDSNDTAASDDTSDSSDSSSNADSSDNSDSSDSSAFVCTETGIFRCAIDCSKYYVCDSSLNLYTMSCSANLVFDQSNNQCNYLDNVPECSA